MSDIVMICTGGSPTPVGSPIFTTNITVTLSPSLPITSRVFPNGGSEALLMIDEPNNAAVNSVFGYGPMLPQILCSSPLYGAGPFGCPQVVGTSLVKGSYFAGVPVSQSATSTPGANMFQGVISGTNSVTFYGVPILPPVTSGLTRVYRITNLRASTVGQSAQQPITATVSNYGNTVLPPQGLSEVLTTVQDPMTATVNSTPSGAHGSFSAGAPPSGAALTARISFTESFGSMFKTRVSALTDTAWASTLPNSGSPGQNVPFVTYASESGFILSSASGGGFTAGLTDYGTRLKAVFKNIPVGVTPYVSTSNAASYTTPGGTNLSTYAVLVATSQSNESSSDGSVITPLTTGTVTGSDGLTAYPLPVSGGTATAIWEVVNTNPEITESVTFSVYFGYSGAVTFSSSNVPMVYLSFAPEPGGGAFTTTSATLPATNIVPRFNLLSVQQGAVASLITSSTQSIPALSPVAALVLALMLGSMAAWMLRTSRRRS